MPRGPFLPSEFVPTKFSSAADKADFGNALLNFLDAGCPQGLFTKKLYLRLSMTFGHIAHYNRIQFYEEWFSSLAAQVQFLKHTLRFPCYGDPEYTFSDVERAIQLEIVNRNYLARYELRLAEEQQAADLVLLRQLENKYRTPAEERGRELQFAVQPSDQTPVAPIQGWRAYCMFGRPKSFSGLSRTGFRLQSPIGERDASTSSRQKLSRIFTGTITGIS